MAGPFRITRRALLRGGIPVLGATALAGCTPWSGLPLLPPPRPGPYRLGAGDRLRIVVFNQKQLTRTYTVGASGDIDLPLLGPVHAAGLTTTALRHKIAAGLKRHGFLRHPSVAVEVATYRPFSILGEVNKPNQYKFEPGMTVLGAVSLAGGFTYRAAESEVGVIRVISGVAREYRAPVSALIEPGDVIKVFQRHF